MDISMVKLFCRMVIILCVSQPWADADTKWTQEDRDQILEIHNDKRNKQEACYMNKLVYDMDLERQAKNWAEKCTFEHERKDNRGENLAMDGTGEEKHKQLIKESTKMWYDEYKYYSSDQSFCEYSCHYTQMVWADTTNIGCYATQCDEYWYLVCFYTPAGNWYGEAPYTTSCEGSQCREGQVAEDHLCVDKVQEDTAEKNGQANEDSNSGTSEQDNSSEDTGQEGSSEEDSGSTSGQQDSSYSGNQEDSSTGGNQGGSDDSSSQEDDSSQDRGGSQETENSCADDRKNCFYWAARGECEENQRWMTQHCKYACGLCDDQCVDDIDNCIYWANAGYCNDDTYGAYMRENCKYSCETCKDPCVNKHVKCPDWANETSCKENVWTANNCKASCGVCESRMPCQDYNMDCTSLVAKGGCESDPDYMLDKCRKSCGQC